MQGILINARKIILYETNMNERIITTERVFGIFSELNKIPRPSHHEERVADYLCHFAERLNLTYERDKENCVVIRKPACSFTVYP